MHQFDCQERQRESKRKKEKENFGMLQLLGSGLISLPPSKQTNKMEILHVSKRHFPKLFS